jgi:hypothetical protein
MSAWEGLLGFLVVLGISALVVVCIVLITLSRLWRVLDDAEEKR